MSKNVIYGVGVPAGLSDVVVEVSFPLEEQEVGLVIPADFTADVSVHLQDGADDAGIDEAVKQFISQSVLGFTAALGADERLVPSELFPRDREAVLSDTETLFAWSLDKDVAVRNIFQSLAGFYADADPSAIAVDELKRIAVLSNALLAIAGIDSAEV